MTIYGLKPTMALSFAALLLLLGGCLSLGEGTREDTRYYALHPMTGETSEGAMGAEAEIVVGVGPVSLPDYLNRPQMVTRVSDSEYHRAEFARWAAPLQENFSRVLAENLASDLSTDRVALFPWHGSVEVDYRVTVEVIRFDGGQEGPVHLDCRWSIIGGVGEKLLTMEKSEFRRETAGVGYGAMAEAMSETVAALSSEVAATIERLDRPSPSGR